MKNDTISILCSLVLVGLITNTGNAQQQSVDQSLSLLRGIWETHTYREKFRIAFLDDKKMVYDRQDAAYALKPERLTIHTEKGNLSYSYAFRDDKLILIDTYGKELDLNRERFGLLERKCLGDYFAWPDTSGYEELLSFNDDGTFSYSRHGKVMGSEADYETPEVKTADIGKYDGVYRVENTFIVLAFNNGFVREAIIRFRDSDDDVTGIVFNGQIFDKEFQDGLTYAPVDGYPPPPPPPPPPPCYGCTPPPCVDCPPPPPPHPPDPGCPPSGGASGTSSPPPEPVRTHRDTGPTRGDSGAGTVDTGSRQGGRRPL